MSAPWQLVVALLTQYPQPPLPELLTRPEVTAFYEPSLCQVENYIRFPAGFVVGLQPQYPTEPRYFVLDERGRIDAKATASLATCLTVPPAARNQVWLAALAGGRGVVVDQTCVVTADGVTKVEELWGERWRELLSMRSGIEIPPRDVSDTFRRTDEYADAVPEERPSLDVVALPGSPYELAVVTRSRLDPVEPGRPLQKIFVTARDGGKTNTALTASLERQLRDELLASCGNALFNLSPQEDDVMLQVDVSRGDWEESCQALLIWDGPNRGLRLEAHDVGALLQQRRAEKVARLHRSAQELWKKGKHDEALEKWKSLATPVPETVQSAEICREYGDALAHQGQYDAAKNQLIACTQLSTNRGEAHLRLAALMLQQGDSLGALAQLEHAREQPLSEADLHQAQKNIVALELSLALEAERQHPGAAKLRMRHLARSALDRHQAAQVRAALGRLK